MKHALLITTLGALIACAVGPAFAAGPVSAVSAVSATSATPATAGLRIFTIGHSMHWWVPEWLADVEAVAGVPAHVQVGISALNGSRVIQHWDLPDEKNKAKAALTGSQVDVLTMSPMLSPDPGIDKFVHLALAHNPKIRITVQEFWLPFDRLDCFNDKSYGEEATRLRDWQDPPPAPDDPHKGLLDTSHFNIPTADQIRKLHAPYFKAMDDYLGKLRQEVGEKSLLVVPVGQAVVALRAKVIAGEASGIAKQSDLFKDKSGHPQAAIFALAAYCHFAVIYQRSPAGLPLPRKWKYYAKIDEKLNRLLQELAWDAVIHQPLSGVKADVPAQPAAKSEL